MKDNKYIVFAGLGFELVGLILGSAFAGNWIDQNYPTKGLGVVGFSVLALAGWLSHVVLLSRKMNAQNDRNS
jgi:hypothetical protein